MSFRERRKQKNTKKIPTAVKSLLSREAKYAYLGRAGRQKYDSKYALNTRLISLTEQALSSNTQLLEYSDAVQAAISHNSARRRQFYADFPPGFPRGKSRFGGKWSFGKTPAASTLAPTQLEDVTCGRIACQLQRQKKQNHPQYPIEAISC